MMNCELSCIELTAAGLADALNIFAELIQKSAETFRQLTEALESVVVIEEESYTMRIPKRRFQTRATYYDPCWAENWAFKNFNPPKRWKPMQDKRKNTVPLGTDTYIRKAKEMKNLARGTKPHKSDPRTGLIQCKHTFEITKVRCAPCDGYDLDCEHYEKTNKGAADSKHLSR